MVLTTLLLLESICLGASLSVPEVAAPVGRIRGISEGQVHVFRGIPYAEAPVGALRWRPPKPIQPWQGVHDASRYRSYCMSIKSKDVLTKGGSEDCLYLNVYAPSEAQRNTSLPCLVWIHGGSFETGSSNDYNATKLVNFWRSQQSYALVVTLNYRLNVFGFLGSDQLRARDVSRSTGNYGMQDQRMALRWVQENIAAFGGNPNKVMLFGQSAGAGSVSCHLAMPLSNGLYSGALMESGGFAGWSAQNMQHKELWFGKLMNHTKCRTVECLVTLPADELLSAYVAIPHGRCCEDMMAAPGIPWAPTIDGVELPDHPLQLLKQQRVNHVPTVTGITLDDGSRFFEQYNLSFTDFVTLFEDQYESSRGQAELYRSESHVSLPGYSDGWWSAERAVTDQNFFCPSHFAWRSLAVTGSPVFGYLFASSSDSPIVHHSSELPFLFMNLTENASLEEWQLAEEVAMSWYRFAALGHPGGHGDRWPVWPQSGEAPILKFQVASKGGTQVIDGNQRDRQCTFMMEWINRTLRDGSVAIRGSVNISSLPKREEQEHMVV